MSEKNAFEEKNAQPRDGNGEADDQEFKINDRRHWQQKATENDEEPAEAETLPRGLIDQYRERAEQAEQKLLEYIEAFKRNQEEQERVRERLARDVDRRVDLQFGEVVSELLESLDDLDLGLDHVRGVAEAEPLAKGVAMARDRFLATLARHGVVRISPEGLPFDPNEAEALRVDPVDDAQKDGLVTETISPGYKLGDRVIRAARVAVASHKKKG